MALAEVLEAADQLTMEEQETLIEILHRRFVDLRRRQIVNEVRESRAAYSAGECRPASVEEVTEVMKEEPSYEQKEASKKAPLRIEEHSIHRINSLCGSLRIRP